MKEQVEMTEIALMRPHQPLAVTNEIVDFLTWKCSPISLQRWQFKSMHMSHQQELKSDGRAAGCVHSLTTQVFFFCFRPNVVTSCRSSARRGQSSIMSALTAGQLFWIQSLDTQRDQTKLWMTSSCRSSCSYSLNILYLRFKGANSGCLLWCLTTLSKYENRQGAFPLVGLAALFRIQVLFCRCQFADLMWLCETTFVFLMK